MTAVSSVVFFLPHILPGDPVIAAAIPGAYPIVENPGEGPGKEESLFRQYIDFMGDAARFRFGVSDVHHRPVSREIFNYLPNTLYLAFAALMLAGIISFPLAIWPVLKKSTAANVSVTLLSAAGQAIPNFVLGPLLILLFSVQLGWLPVSGGSGVKGLVLPALTLGFSLCAVLTRITRDALEHELKKPYLLLARAKGLSPFQVLRGHVLKNAMPVILTTFGMQLGALLCGTVITETVFSWRGIGSLLVMSIQQRDFPMIRGLIVFFTVVYLLVNFIADLSCFLLDPRRRSALAEK